MSLPKRILIFRLSSLGDLILSTAPIARLAASGAEIHWVVRSDFEELLRDHPQVSRLWVFDRRTGLRGWMRLCRELRAEGFDEILDLHRTMRTRLARLIFGRASRRRWKSVRKPRARRLVYFFFKGLWPRRWRPRPWVELFSETAGGDGSDRPDFRFLAKKGVRPGGLPSSYICLMPSSRWPGKEWPPARYVEVLRQLRLPAVVLGTEKDVRSLEVVSLFEQAGLPVVSGVGRWRLADTAAVLSGARAYLGCDTGLAHLAEALGVPAWVLLGPTAADSGFGPWQKDSIALGRRLWCRPCGKDGRTCIRVFKRHTCLNDLSSYDVLVQLLRETSRSEQR